MNNLATRPHSFYSLPLGRSACCWVLGAPGTAEVRGCPKLSTWQNAACRGSVCEQQGADHSFSVCFIIPVCWQSFAVLLFSSPQKRSLPTLVRLCQHLFSVVSLFTATAVAVVSVVSEEGVCSCAPSADCFCNTDIHRAERWGDSLQCQEVHWAAR